MGFIFLDAYEELHFAADVRHKYRVLYVPTLKRVVHNCEVVWNTKLFIF